MFFLNQQLEIQRLLAIPSPLDIWPSEPFTQSANHIQFHAYVYGEPYFAVDVYEPYCWHGDMGGDSFGGDRGDYTFDEGVIPVTGSLLVSNNCVVDDDDDISQEDLCFFDNAL